MKKLVSRELFWLFLITLAGGIIRFYKLGQVPSGFVNDEASFGYNAYSLIKTGKDEFGVSWPLFFKSFGDFKLPVYFYLTIPSIIVFGLTEFAVRFPSAFFGTLTIPLAYFFTKKIHQRQPALWPILSSLILAFLPWHIHFSRAAFEANVALFFITLATLWFLNQKYFLAFSLYLVSIFTYHAPRLFVPLWAISLVVLLFKSLKPNLKKIILLFTLTIVVPSIFMFTSNGLSRANSISVFNQQSGVQSRLSQKFRQTIDQPLTVTRAFHNKLESYSREILGRYFSHFDSDFLFFSGDPLRPRYQVPDVGQALLITLPFFLVGIYLSFKNKYWMILTWLLLAPLPAALTFETPSSIRSYLMILPLSLMIALGFSKLKNKFLIIIISLGFIYNFFFYLNAYYVHMPVDNPYEWQGGYKELVSKVNQLESGYQKIIITDKKSTPYIFFLFYNQYSPAKWQQQVASHITPKDKFNFIGINQLEKIDFQSHACPVHPLKDDILYVCTGNEHPSELINQKIVTIIDTVNYQNEANAFTLMVKNKNLGLPLDYDPD